MNNEQKWWEKHFSKHSLIKHTCSWCVNLLYYEQIINKFHKWWCMLTKSCRSNEIVPSLPKTSLITWSRGKLKTSYWDFHEGYNYQMGVNEYETLPFLMSFKNFVVQLSRRLQPPNLAGMHAGMKSDPWPNHTEIIKAAISKLALMRRTHFYRPFYFWLCDILKSEEHHITTSIL